MSAVQRNLAAEARLPRDWDSSSSIKSHLRALLNPSLLFFTFYRKDVERTVRRRRVSRLQR